MSTKPEVMSLVQDGQLDNWTPINSDVVQFRLASGVIEVTVDGDSVLVCGLAGLLRIQPRSANVVRVSVEPMSKPKKGSRS